MLSGVSIKQKKVYDFYVKFIKEQGYSPTYQKVSEELGISPSVVYSHILSLEKKGYLRRNESGKVDLLKHNQINKAPILGKIACGEPLEVIEENNEYITIPENISEKNVSGLYVLIAKGESMINAGITDGDYLVIKSQSDVNDGEIGVVIVREDFDEYATFKKVFHSPKSLLLKPANNDFDPFVITQGAEIRGKLVGIIKKM